jgi:hypothetical protein
MEGIHPLGILQPVRWAYSGVLSASRRRSCRRNARYTTKPTMTVSLNRYVVEERLERYL